MADQGVRRSSRIASRNASINDVDMLPVNAEADDADSSGAVSMSYSTSISTRTTHWESGTSTTTTETTTTTTSCKRQRLSFDAVEIEQSTLRRSRRISMRERNMVLDQDTEVDNMQIADDNDVSVMKSETEAEPVLEREQEASTSDSEYVEEDSDDEFVASPIAFSRRRRSLASTASVRMDSMVENFQTTSLETPEPEVIEISSDEESEDTPEENTSEEVEEENETVVVESAHERRRRERSERLVS
jgi:hypothetical protein